MATRRSLFCTAACLFSPVAAQTTTSDDRCGGRAAELWTQRPPSRGGLDAASRADGREAAWSAEASIVGAPWQHHSARGVARPEARSRLEERGEAFEASRVDGLESAWPAEAVFSGTPWQDPSDYGDASQPERVAQFGAPGHERCGAAATWPEPRRLEERCGPASPQDRRGSPDESIRVVDGDAAAAELGEDAPTAAGARGCAHVEGDGLGAAAGAGVAQDRRRRGGRRRRRRGGYGGSRRHSARRRAWRNSLALSARRFLHSAARLIQERGRG